MPVLFLIAMLLCISITIGLIFSKNITFTFFPTIMLISLTVYLFGCLGLLNVGCIVLIIISFVSLIFNIVNIKKIKEIFSVELFLYLIILFLLSIVFFSKAHFTMWDEFTHWGSVLKNMFYFKSLPTDSFTSVANAYPPIISVFEYILLFISKKYNEGLIYIALFILTSSVFVESFANISIKKNKCKFIITSILLIVFPNIFAATSAFSSIYVDTIISLFFAYSLLKIVNDEPDLFSIISSSLCLSFLFLTKDVGLVFGIVIYFSIFLNFIKRRNKYSKLLVKKSFIRKIGLLVLILLPIMFRIIWFVYITNNIRVLNTYDMINFSYPDYGLTVISTFLSTFFTNGLSTTSGLIFMPTFYWIILSCFLLYYSNKKECLELISNIFVLTIGYLLFYLISYLFLFNESEALSMASVGRYLSTLALSVFAIPVYGGLVAFNNSKSCDNNHFIIVLAIVAFSIGYFPYVGKVFDLFSESQNNYSQYDTILKYKDVLNDNNKVYYLSIDSTGLDYYIVQYLVTPYMLQNDKYDLYNCSNERPCADFNVILNNYDYVWLEHINKQFLDDYESLFDSAINEKSMYKVINNKLVLLNDIK